MAELRRVQLSRAAGWRMPENTVKVDRSTWWGNQFHIVAADDDTFKILSYGSDGRDEPLAVAATMEEARAKAAELFREWLFGPYGIFWRERARNELRGKNLACWCAPGGPCHADALLDAANGPVCEAVP